MADPPVYTGSGHWSRPMIEWCLTLYCNVAVDGMHTKSPQSTSCQTDRLAQNSWECGQQRKCPSNVCMPEDGYSDQISAELVVWNLSRLISRADLVVHCGQHKLQPAESVAFLDRECSVWYMTLHWWRGTVVERRSLAGELSLSCARPAADGWPLLWVSHQL